MVTFTSVLVAITGATTILANPIKTENALQNLIARGPSTPNGRGTHDGFYWDFWSDGQGSVNYTNEAGGKYSVAWSNTGNFVGGKGWSPGTGRNITYSGIWDGAAGNSYIALYGWMDKPPTEYYIIECFGTYDPRLSYPSKGNITVDGGTYTIQTNARTVYTGGPGGGLSLIRQIWSTRHEKRVGGTINVQAHLDAWVKAGATLGTHTYQILATEAYMYKNSGSATITVQGP